MYPSRLSTISIASPTCQLLPTHARTQVQKPSCFGTPCERTNLPRPLVCDRQLGREVRCIRGEKGAALRDAWMIHDARCTMMPVISVGGGNASGSLLARNHHHHHQYHRRHHCADGLNEVDPSCLLLRIFQVAHAGNVGTDASFVVLVVDTLLAKITQQAEGAAGGGRARSVYVNRPSCRRFKDGL